MASTTPAPRAAGSRPRFGVMLPQSGRLATPSALIDVAQAAEELGYFAVSARDHVIFDGSYITSGMLGLDIPGDDRTMIEALEALTYVASATRTIHLGSSVLILPNRHPLLLAKQLGTLDYISGGRLVLGFGIGPNRVETAKDTTLLGGHRTSLVREYDSFGAAGPRGPRMDEYFEALVKLWTEEQPSLDGTYVHFEDVLMFPKPVQRPYPPILVGGRSTSSLRRAARWGAGWLPSQVTVDEVRHGLAELAALRGEAELDAGVPVGINMHSIIGQTTDAAVAAAAPTLGHHFADRQAYEERTLSGDIDTFARRVEAYASAGVNYVDLKPVVPSIDALIEQLRTIHDALMV